MKKNLLKTVTMFALAMLVVFGVKGTEVKAETSVTITNEDYKLHNKSTKTVTLTNKNKKNGLAYAVVDIKDGSYKNIKVTSSKKSVATVKQGSWYKELRVYPKKTGTTKITWTATNSKMNKKVTQTCTIKVVKYENPVSTLKIAGKSYTLKEKSDVPVIDIKTSKTKLKLNYKLKKNWKIVKSESGYNTWNAKNCKWETQSIKNGKTYKLRKNAPTSFYFYLRNSKTGATVRLGIAINE